MDTANPLMVQLDFADEMRTSYRDYATSVIISRALPDVRDGLKPVQRRILYAMSELSLTPDKPHRKSARIVGDTMGKYHPHGDSSIYEALVRMTEDFSLTLPLVDGHGNFGSIDGDGAAAMRYTEARLSAGAMLLLENLDKGLVPFGPNFDESEKEPLVLPAAFPNLLVNGTTGIAVGMATNIPPHNLGEVIDGVIATMKNPDITTKGLCKYIKGPDFPTGGMITNADDLLSVYETGEGKLTLRAKTETEDSQNGRKNIVITQIPYTVAGNKAKLLESLVELEKNKVFDEIYDVRDESSKEGIRLIVEVKKDRDIENLLNGLYKKTALEDTYSVNMLAVKDKQPMVFDLKSLIAEFVNFREELTTKEYDHRRKKADERLEIVNGLIDATDCIDLIIEILRGSDNVKQAKDCLICGKTDHICFKSERAKKQAEKLSFTQRQADAILAMPLSKLIGLEIVKLRKEKEELEKNLREFQAVLDDKGELDKVIIARLKEYKKKFGRPRRTALTNLTRKNYVENVREEEIAVLIDRFGYTKSVDLTNFSRIAPENLTEYTHMVRLKNTDKLCLFTDAGNMVQVKVNAIPRGKSRDKGVLIQNLCKLNHETILLAIGAFDLLESALFFATAKGFVKQVSGIEFDTNRSVIAATKLEAEDRVVGITTLSAQNAVLPDKKVILVTENGCSLGFLLTEVLTLKKTGRGIRGITLEKGDCVQYAAVVSPDCTKLCLGKTVINPKKIKCRKRGAKGQKAAIEAETK